MRVVAVTGANGFVGHNVVPRLEAAGWRVRQIVREAPSPSPNIHAVGDIGGATDWAPAIQGCDAVVHLAGLAHVPKRGARSTSSQYRTVNVDGTLALARAAAAGGVRRLVFLSSSKVNGEGRADPYRIADAPAPSEPYAHSKWEAEQGLWQIAAGGRLEVAIVRPPLVYGPGVRANFLRLMTLVDRGIPLPFGGITNRRSIVFAGNLASFILQCLDDPRAAGRTLFAADAAPLSTPELLRALAAALSRPVRLFSFPPGLLRAGAAALGRADEVGRLLDSFVVDVDETRHDLGWTPPYRTAEGLAETARWYRTRSR